MNVLKGPDSTLWRTNFHMPVKAGDLFSFPQKLRVSRVLATCITKQHILVFIQEGFVLDEVILPASHRADGGCSSRLKLCFTTATATSGCHHLLVRFPYVCPWVFHLMFPSSPWSHRNKVSAEVLCLEFCGDHLIPVILSFIHLPLTNIKVWILLPPLMGWFSLSFPSGPAGLHDQLLLFLSQNTEKQSALLGSHLHYF